MTVRAAEERDFATIADITNHYIATTTIHFGYEPVAADQLIETWRSHASHPWYVADDAGIVGYAKSAPWRERAAYAWTCETAVYVAANAVGRGHGRALYGALLTDVAARGFRSAIAVIALPNPASLVLHQQLGFNRVGMIQDAGYKLGQWCDVALLQRCFLADSPSPAG
jgi:phosphinothricin acetyltransferase